MFGLCFVAIIISVGSLEATRVSRIKPSYFSQNQEDDMRFSTVSTSRESLPNVDRYRTTNRPTKAPLLYTPEIVSPSASGGRSCDKPYSCVDCTTFRLCIPSEYGLVELYSGSCPEDRPYCDSYSGTCANSVETAVQCATPDKSFRCMRDGHFPHPLDPGKYFICSDFKAYGYSCKEGHKFYAPARECSGYSWLANPFDCGDLNATKVLYNNGGSYFAYCVNGQPLLVSSCVENEFFNTTSQVCEPQCNKESIAPDSNNCVRYFRCTKNNITQAYEKVSFKCPNGEGFSNNLKKCVPLNQLPSCKVGAVHHN